MINIKDFLPKYREISSILANASSKGNITYPEQCFITEFYREYEDIKTFEKIILELIINTDDNKYSLLMSNLRNEIENTIKSYETGKDILDSIDIHKFCESVTSQYDDAIKTQSDITGEYRRELNHVNGSLDAIGFREHTKQEEQLLWREHERLTKLYNYEKEKLDSLYADKEKLQREVSKYNRNLFSLIYDLSQSYLSIIDNYFPRKTKEETVSNEQPVPFPKEGYFSMDLIASVHNVCNNVQFENLSALDFYALINLQPANARLIYKSGEKTRVCYLIHKLYEYLKTDNRSDWRSAILRTLEIKEDFYKSKYKQAAECKERKSDSFAQQIDEIFD